MGQIQERYENYVRRGLMEEVVARAFYGLDGWLEAPPKILRTLDDRIARAKDFAERRLKRQNGRRP